jgi:hypothetical protein
MQQVSGVGTAGQVLRSNGASALPSWQSDRSEVNVSGALANGSTNTTVARFATVNNNTGSDITYADSATLGASFTINTDGIYTMSFASSGAATGRNTAITLNGTALSTDPGSLTYAQGLRSFGGGSTGGSVTVPSNWTGFIAATGVIRAQINTIGTNSDLTMFNIVKIGG